MQDVNLAETEASLTRPDDFVSRLQDIANKPISDETAAALQKEYAVQGVNAPRPPPTPIPAQDRAPRSAQPQEPQSGHTDEEVAQAQHLARIHSMAWENGDTDLLNSVTHQMASLKVPAVEDMQDLDLGDGKTASSMVAQTYKSMGDLAQQFEQINEQFLGPGGKLDALRKAEQSTAKDYQDLMSYTRYGLAPDRVDELQTQMRSNDPIARAAASSELQRAQDKAMNPGDPSRIWNNMTSFQQSMFLAGNTLSMLGMSLMHVNGPTPMDQLNKEMENEYQAQKDKFGRGQQMLKNAEDAYSFAASRTKNELAREALTKSMLMEPMRLQLEGLGKVQEAQKIQFEQQKYREAAKHEAFMAHLQALRDTADALKTKAALTMKEPKPPTPIPTADRKAVVGTLQAIDTMAKYTQHPDFKLIQTGSDYNKGLEDTAAEIEGLLPERGAAGQRAKGLKSLMTAGMTEGAGAVQRRANGWMLEKLRDAETQIRTLAASGKFDPQEVQQLIDELEQRKRMLGVTPEQKKYSGQAE